MRMAERGCKMAAASAPSGSVPQHPRLSRDSGAGDQIRTADRWSPCLREPRGSPLWARAFARVLAFSRL